MVREICLAAAVALGVSGCATITRGTTEEVRVEVDPPDATITTSTGMGCKGIPCKLSVSRKTSFTVTASKPGYKDESVFVDTVFSGGGAAGMAGNVLIGGVIGVGVDAASGATLNHQPNPVLIALTPVDPRNRSTPAGRRAALEAKIKAEQEEWRRKHPAPGS